MAVPKGSSSTPIIHAKVAVPAAPAHWVPRRRLDVLLADLVERSRIVVVTATAGSGKTAAVRSAALHQHRPVAWLTVGPTEIPPGRLITYLEAALAEVLPDLHGRATGALQAGLPHAEAAGLLADAIGDRPVLLVIDELERFPPGADDAWDILEALSRYLPEPARMVLLSRRDLPIEAWRQAVPGRVAAMGEHDLAFTSDEAAAALARIGSAEVDAEEAVRATGGWVTGVLFEAWRSTDHVMGAGGEADPLHGYLASHVLAQLDPADRDFLVRTSLISGITAARAEALGIPDAAERMASLRGAHLPASWEGKTLRCHPRFRQYLREALDQRGAAETRALRLAHGRLLAAEGHDEEATEELLAMGAIESARGSAERAIMSVVARGDLDVAQRWLDALGFATAVPSTPLTTAALMLAIARDDYRDAARIADELDAAGARDAIARRSPTAAVLMSWTYVHLARLEDAQAVLDVARPDLGVEAAHIALGLASGDVAQTVPSALDLTGGPLDAMVLRIAYAVGRVDVAVEPGADRWQDLILAPWRIASFRMTGQTQQAVELYESAIAAGLGSVALHAYIGPEALIDAGRHAEARQAIDAGRRQVNASGSLGFQTYNAIVDAKLRLRVERDVDGARQQLDRAEARIGDHAFPVYRELIDTWHGLALLLAGDDAGAATRLRRAVDSMADGARLTDLSTAAVYLAEAEWRAGEEEAADAAADMALTASATQGSNHLLLQALADFPAVLTRRLDAEAAGDSPWHEVGRALAAQGVDARVVSRPRAELADFGPPELKVDGEPRRPRLSKTYELLAFLLQAGDQAVSRSDLLVALFDGRADDQARGYLRQAIHQLRSMFDDAGAVVGVGTAWRLADPAMVVADSFLFESGLAEAARLRGAPRLEATQTALALFDRGPFLAPVTSAWVEERRSHLLRLALDARHDAAELAFELGAHAEAARLASAVLQEDPFHESTWRLRMRLAEAMGDVDRVLHAYQQCERALAELGTTPSRNTRDLLEQLRR